jgi:hypothetical protein
MNRVRDSYFCWMAPCEGMLIEREFEARGSVGDDGSGPLSAMTCAKLCFPLEPRRPSLQTVRNALPRKQEYWLIITFVAGRAS